jgi:hypothetical protein
LLFIHLLENAIMQAFVVRQGSLLKHWWNLSSNVGLKSPNNPDDVQLVQFGFFCMGLPTSKISDPQFRGIYAAVVPGSRFAAIENDPLQIAIRTLERSRGGAQDGHISPAPQQGFSYGDKTGRHAFLIGTIMNNAFDAVGAAVWPRLDKHPRCPPLVAAHVRAASTFD